VDALHEIAARAAVRQVRDEKSGADPVQIRDEEHDDRRVKGDLCDARLVLHERHHEHDAGER
jgi:hypothetical protein